MRGVRDGGGRVGILINDARSDPTNSPSTQDSSSLEPRLQPKLTGKLAQAGLSTSSAEEWRVTPIILTTACQVVTSK